jgi:hypothetical protein
VVGRPVGDKEVRSLVDDDVGNVRTLGAAVIDDFEGGGDIEGKE